MGSYSLIFLLAVLFLLAERVLPARDLPHSAGWYGRAILLNAGQLGITILAGLTWNAWLRDYSLFQLPPDTPSMLYGFVAWFIGTFVFYWWHRFRHKNALCWRVFHQIHHSPSRIEALTAFYKHPIEITVNSILASTIIFVLLGSPVEAAGWYNLFAVAGELFYHSNLKTPHWMGYFMQRPEHHSIHHQLNVHDYNYGDITWWDRLFGTFKDTNVFAARCGFRDHREAQLGQMLLFHDVN